MASITCDGQIVKVDGLAIDDPGLAELLRAQPEDRWDELVERALVVGARGLLTMGLGIDLTEVDGRVRRAVEEVTAEAQRHVEAVLGTARQTFAEQFDPEHRSSAVARALGEFTSWRDGFLQGLDPDYADSHTSRFLEQLEELLGPSGLLETRLQEALDLEADGSALGRLSRVLETRLTDLRDLIVGAQQRQQEADRGTAKGVAFEDVVEDHLRDVAAGLGGCVVERTGREPGELGRDATVGDFVVSLPTGHRLVVEVKNVARIGLSGKDGILGELDRAIANRRADFAVCVSAQDAYPKEVGAFNLYGNRLLVVDEGEGSMTAVGVRTAAAILAAGGLERGDLLDAGLVVDRLDRIRNLAELFNTNRKALTGVTNSVEKVRESLKGMRTDLLGLVDELATEVRRVSPDSTTS